MSYLFKTWPELAWAVFVALVTYLYTIAQTGLPAGDWKAITIAIAAGAGRAVLAAIMAFISKSGGFTAS